MAVWINEFHYDNPGTDAGEFIEVAGDAGTDLSQYKLVLYNGNGGTAYNTLTLSGVIPNLQNGFGVASFAYAVNGIQNGGTNAATNDPDGIALIGPGDTLIEFISYEGPAFTAANGLAAGATSTPIGVAEPARTGDPSNTSIARVGLDGNEASDFTWVYKNAVSNGASTAGTINGGQTFAAPPPTDATVSIGDATVTEGDSGTTLITFTVTRSNNAGAFTVDYNTANNTAFQPGDYVAQTGTVEFTAGGGLTATVEIEVVGDTTQENTESFFVQLANLVNTAGTATLQDATGEGTITDNDAPPPPPTINIADASVAEGNAGTTSLTFTVTRSSGTGVSTVQYAATDGTAAAGSDYTAASGTVTFEDGDLEETVTVDVTGDLNAEPNEAFTITLSDPTNAVIGDGSATGTIQNDDILRIHDVQGTSHFSPILAAEGKGLDQVSSAFVTVEGVVTARDTGSGFVGFYLMEEQADWDGDFRTSEGIYVRFASNAGFSDITVGETVRVTANVIEEIDFDNLPRTMLVNPTIDFQSNAATTIPVYLLDGVGERKIPSAILTDEVPDYLDSVDDAGDVFDPQTDALDFWETVEGMQIALPDVRIADGFTGGAAGSLRFKAYSTAHADADQINSRGGYTINGDAAVSPQDDTATPLDDVRSGGDYLHDGDTNPDIFELDFSTPGSVSSAGFAAQVSMGDQLGTVTGVVDFDFRNVKLFVTQAVTFTDNVPQRETVTLPSDARSLRLATFNVENLDPGDDNTVDELNIDGTGKFNDLARAIADNLGAPDILSIEEIQDNNGTAQGGTDASVTWQRLANAVSTQTGFKYQWVDEAPVENTEGGAPGGNIRVGFLYRVDRVQLGDGSGDLDDAAIATRRQFTDRIGDGTRDAGDLIAFDDGQIAGEIQAADWAGTRKSLLGQFNFNGNSVYAIANHWPSKSAGDDTFYQRDQNLPAGQPENSDWEQRNAVAQDVWTMMDRISTDAPNARIAAAGDMNDFYFYRPLEALTGYVDQDGNARVGGARFDNLTVTELPEAERYTYTFDGRSQAIDHIVVDQALSAVASYDVVHIGTGFGRQGPTRLSDHDPAVAQFDFRSFGELLGGTDVADLIEGFGGNDTVDAGDGNDSLLGGDGADTLNGEAGDDRFEGGAGNDTTDGGAGNDRFIVRNDGRDTVDGGEGLDTLEGIFDGESGKVVFNANADGTFRLRVGFVGNVVARGEDVELFNIRGGTFGDSFIGGSGGDTFFGGAGNDVLNGGAGGDLIEGQEDADSITGGEGNDTIFGGAGNDRILADAGDDVIDGGAGADFISAGGGRDVISGGADADVFVFLKTADINPALPDRILDFEDGVDTIDLSAIDANLLQSGNQAFTLMTTPAPFTTPGQLRVQVQNGATYIYLNTDADNGVEGLIILSGVHALTQDDFIL